MSIWGDFGTSLWEKSFLHISKYIRAPFKKASQTPFVVCGFSVASAPCARVNFSPRPRPPIAASSVWRQSTTPPAAAKHPELLIALATSSYVALYA
jgi:hypothetical protein